MEESEIETKVKLCGCWFTQNTWKI